MRDREERFRAKFKQKGAAGEWAVGSRCTTLQGGVRVWVWVWVWVWVVRASKKGGLGRRAKALLAELV